MSGPHSQEMRIMKSSIKFGAALGALALAASLGLGATQASAAVTLTPVVNVDVTDAPRISATVAGCSAADGAVAIEYSLFNWESGYSTADTQVEVPATGSATIDFRTPLPGSYDLDVRCLSYAGQDATWLYTSFESAKGQLDLAGPGGSDEWQNGDPVTLTSPVVGGVHAFDPNSVVTIVVIAPDGTEYTLAAATADANGSVSVDRVLPDAITGLYTVRMTGIKTIEGQATPVEIILEGRYMPADEVPVDPTDPPVAPPTTGKPTALPRTGSEGINLISAAALISAVAGGAAVALRRKH